MRKQMPIEALEMGIYPCQYNRTIVRYRGGTMDNSIILHSDMNCFYASCEIMKNPSLRNVPLAIFGDSDFSRSAIILARNDLAKKAGVKTAEPTYQAREKCPVTN